MKKLLALSVLAFSLIGCTNTRKFTGFVNEKCAGNRSLSSYEYNSDFLQVKTDDIDKQDSLCVTTRQKAVFVPAILYWHWNNTVKCVMDPKYYAAKAAYYLKTEAETSGLRDKLNGGKVNVSIKEVPNTFLYMNKGNVLIVLFYYLMILKEGIVPIQQDLVLEYEIVRSETVSGKRTVVIPNRNMFIPNSMNSRRKLTSVYLDEADNNLRAMSKDAVLKIMTQL